MAGQPSWYSDCPPKKNPKNLVHVEDIEILVPLKFPWVLAIGFRGEVKMPTVQVSFRLLYKSVCLRRSRQDEVAQSVRNLEDWVVDSTARVWSSMRVPLVVIGPSIRLDRKVYRLFHCYSIHQTYTNFSSWQDLLMSYSGLCPWLRFQAWVNIVWKEWLSVYYSTHGCYIHEAYTNCSPRYDLLMLTLCGDLCLWPTFYARVVIVKKKWLNLYYST